MVSTSNELQNIKYPQKSQSGIVNYYFGRSELMRKSSKLHRSAFNLLQIPKILVKAVTHLHRLGDALD